MIVVVLISSVLLAVGAVLAVVRLERGPSMLDRTIAFDLLTSVLVGTIAIEAAWSRRTETIPMLVALSLVGFLGSVVIARFAAREPDDVGQMRPETDVAAEHEQRTAARAEQREGAFDAEHHGGSAPGEVR